jgi:protein SCO1/2
MLLSTIACADRLPHGPWHGAELVPAKPKSDFTLTSTDGTAFSFRQATDGNVALLFFGYTSCPDICPVHMANIAEALAHLDDGARKRIRVVFVSTDPERDTPRRLRAWLDNFDSSFVGLRGSSAEVNRLEALFGLASSYQERASAGGQYGVGHAAQILAFTPDDSLRVMYPFGVRQQDWVEDLPRLLRIPARDVLVIRDAIGPAPLRTSTADAATMSVYLTIDNRGTVPDTLVRVETPAAAMAMLHETVADGGMRRMTPLPALVIPAHATVQLSPGALHLMLEGMTTPPAAGDTIELSLVFAHAGRMSLRVHVVSYGRLDAELALARARAGAR